MKSLFVRIFAVCFVLCSSVAYGVDACPKSNCTAPTLPNCNPYTAPTQAECEQCNAEYTAYNEALCAYAACNAYNTCVDGATIELNLCTRACNGRTGIWQRICLDLCAGRAGLGCATCGALLTAGCHVYGGGNSVAGLLRKAVCVAKEGNPTF